MARLLIRNIPGVAATQEKMDKMYQIGDVVAIFEDGHIFGTKEAAPNFSILDLPGPATDYEYLLDVDLDVYQFVIISSGEAFPTTGSRIIYVKRQGPTIYIRFFTDTDVYQDFDIRNNQISGKTRQEIGNYIDNNSIYLAEELIDMLIDDLKLPVQNTIFKKPRKRMWNGTNFEVKA